MVNSEETVSSSLIRTKPRVSLSSEDGKPFCLGLPDWCPCDDCSKVKSVEEPVKNGTTLKLDDKKPLKLKCNKNRCSKELTKSNSLEPHSKELKVLNLQKNYFKGIGTEAKATLCNICE